MLFRPKTSHMFEDDATALFFGTPTDRRNLPKKIKITVMRLNNSSAMCDLICDDSLSLTTITS